MTERILVYGYGNPGRRDDGLGPAFVRELEARGLDAGVSIESAYQPQVEDAALAAGTDSVVFVDATAIGPEPFFLRPLAPQGGVEFSTHSVAPEAVLALARDHFHGRAAGWLLGIRGYEFDDFGEGLSPGAQLNLLAAADFLQQALRDGRLLGPTAAPGAKR